MKIPCDFLIDEIGVGSYFFSQFLDVYVVQNRVLRLSKGLFCETYSIKEFVFDPHIAYQSYKPTAELHLSRKEFLLSFENLKLIKKSYDNISKTLFIPTQLPNLLKLFSKVLYSSIILRISKIKILHDQVWNQISKFCYEKIINFEL